MTMNIAQVRLTCDSFESFNILSEDWSEKGLKKLLNGCGESGWLFLLAEERSTVNISQSMFRSLLNIKTSYDDHNTVHHCENIKCLYCDHAGDREA